MKRICVFCGSSEGARPVYRETARELADALCERGITLVYGGSRRGTMGELAARMLARGGRVIGVMPRMLEAREQALEGLSELVVVEDLPQRKARMAALSEAFIALPGGFGTLDEVAEMLTLSQLGLHAKPLGLLNAAGYYDSLRRFFDHMTAEGFLETADRARVLVADRPAALLALLEAAAA